MSVVSASAGRAGRTNPAVSRLVNSAARCWQSAALPPLPQSISLPPARRLSVILWAADSIDAVHCVAVVRRRSAPASKCELMWSADMGLGAKLVQQRGHFDCGLRCVCTVIAGLEAGAFPSLFNIFGGEHAENHRHAALLAGIRNSGSSLG